MICSICASLPLRAAQVSIHYPKNRFWSKPCSKHYINVAQAIDTLNFQSYLKNKEIIRNIHSFCCWSRSRYHWLSLLLFFWHSRPRSRPKRIGEAKYPKPSHGSNKQVRNATGSRVACEEVAWSRWNPLKPCSAPHRRSSRKQSASSRGCLGFKKKVGFRDWLSRKELSDPRPQLPGLPEMSLPPRWSYLWGLERRISAKPRFEDKLRSPKEARFGRIDIDHPLSVSWIEESECH